MERSVVEGGEHDQDPDAPPTGHFEKGGMSDCGFSVSRARGRYGDACTHGDNKDEEPYEKSPDSGEGEGKKN